MAGRLAAVAEWLGFTNPRDISPYSLDQYATDLFTFNGTAYPINAPQQTMAYTQADPIANDFTGLIHGAYEANGVVFACMMARYMIFSEARLQFRRIRNGKPGDLFGTPALDIVEHPWPGGTTSDLMKRALIDADLAGNFFVTRSLSQLHRLRPDWTSVLIGTNDGNGDSFSVDATVLGYVYFPGGRYAKDRDPVFFGPNEVAHFKPYPDGEAGWRGMSWLTPVIREISSDGAATSHKLKFFENAATPNMTVKTDQPMSEDKFNKWVELMEEKHSGVANAYKTLYLAGGADATVVGLNFQQMDFKVIQGAGETRIAAAAGFHPTIVGLSEGLQGSSLNAGNFAAARRITADKTMRPLWRDFCGSLATICPPPGGSELWYDDTDIAFLREDSKDIAEIQQTQANALKSLIDSGWVPDSARDAVMADDMSKLVHSGLYSVQLQPPMPEQTTPDPATDPTAPATVVADPTTNGAVT